MSVNHNNPGMAVLASVDLLACRLVTYLGAYCGADSTNDVFGVTTNSCLATEQSPVRFKSAGTMRCTASVAISAGALVYKAANGKVGVTNTNALVGRALEAASADGVELEVLPIG